MSVKPRREWDLMALVGLLPAVAILPLLVFSGVLMYLLTQQGRETAQQTLVDASASLARVVQTELHRAAEDLERLAFAASGEGGNPLLLRRLAPSLVGPDRPFDAIVLVSPRGKEVVAGTAGAGTDDAGRPPVTERGVTNLRKTSNAERGVVELATPLQGEPGSTLLGQLNLRGLSRSLADLAGERSFATVLDAQGLIIARSTDFDRYFGQKPSPQTRRALDAQSAGTARFSTRDGRELFWSWNTLPDIGWAVFLGTRAKELDAAFRESLLRLLAGTGIALVLGSFAAWSVGRRIVRAANEMAEQAPGLVSGRNASFRPSGLKQIDALYKAMSVAGNELNQAHRERDYALRAEQMARELAERHNKAKDVFIATLSHELRNPLAPISNAAKVILHPGLPQAQVQRAARVVDRQARTLSHLLDDLLDVSRITTGRINLTLRPTAVAEVFDAAVEATRPLLQERRHELSVRIQPEDLAVNGDRLRLIQVVSNLLNNAAKYTEPGGRIELAAAVDGEDRVLMSVTDNGIGVPPEFLGRVFDIFEQIEGERARSRGGLGIGLSLVKGIVELHGGSVFVSSDGPGKGSRFGALLPRATLPAPVSSPAVGKLRGTGKGPTAVLLVDDNVDAAVTMKVLLEASGEFEVDVTHTGRDALAMAEGRHYDAICLDIGLPDMEGYEVARRLQSMTEAKLVATTGWGSENDKRRAYEAGFDAHLTKPVDPADLIRQLHLLSASSVPPLTNEAPG